MYIHKRHFTHRFSNKLGSKVIRLVLTLRVYKANEKEVYDIIYLLMVYCIKQQKKGQDNVSILFYKVCFPDEDLTTELWRYVNDITIHCNTSRTLDDLLSIHANYIFLKQENFNMLRIPYLRTYLACYSYLDKALKHILNKTL